jgi:integrase
MKYKIREYRPGHFQVRFNLNGERINLQKLENGMPLNSEAMARVLILHLKRDGYDPNRFGKDKTFQFENAIDTWVKLSSCSQEWIEQRRQIANRFFIPFFKKKDIRQIQSIHIAEFLKWLKTKNFKDKSLYNYMGELKSFFRFHKKSLEELPEFERVRVQEPVVNWMTADEQDRVFKCIKQEDLPIFIFMRTYGCRTNEASGLQKRNIYLEADPPYVILENVLGACGKLKLMTKTRKIKVLPILPEIKWIFQNGNESDFVFFKNGRPYSNKMLNRVWNRANKESGVKIVNLYNSMRHSFGFQRLNQGYGLDQIGAVMGHMDGRSTKRYAKYQVEKLIDVIRGNVSRVFPHSQILQIPEKIKIKKLGGEDSNLGSKIQSLASCR